MPLSKSRSWGSHLFSTTRRHPHFPPQSTTPLLSSAHRLSPLERRTAASISSHPPAASSQPPSGSSRPSTHRHILAVTARRYVLSATVACKRKYLDNDPEGKAASMVSSWQEEIQKPSWRPFTTIKVDGEDKEVVDDNGPKLRQLRLECGDSVCCAVKVALSEINEYSPHGRHVVNEIWNFPEGRKAMMTDAIMYIMEQLTVADPGLGGCEFKIPRKNRSTSI